MMPPAVAPTQATPLTTSPQSGATLRWHGLRTLPALCLLAGLVACSPSAKEAPAAPAPAAVGVVTLQPERLAQTIELPGRTSARLIAEIRPQVGGIVQQRPFTEGAQVRAGEVLYQIDPASLQAVLASAEAAVGKAEATVAAAQTSARRSAELVKIDAVSQQADDEAQAALKQAQADLAVARAAEKTARINLGFTRITAPISGRVGLSTVTPGALVTANQTTALTTVQQLDPIHVDVTQSSTELLRLRQELAAGRLQRAGNNEARIRLLLEDGSPYPEEGRLTFSGLTVNSSTGAVTLRAVVPNPQGVLLPGMYLRAVLQEGVNNQALLVPQRAVSRNASGASSVLLLTADNKVERRSIQVDRAFGDRWQVVGGLAAGDRVVVDGLQKARVGATVRPVAVASAASAAAPASGASASAASAAR